MFKTGEDQTDPRVEKLLSKLPQRVKHIVQPQVIRLNQELANNFSIIEIASHTMQKDIAIAIRMLSQTPQTFIFVAQSQQRANFMIGLCKQIDPQKTQESLTIHRKEAPSKHVFLGDFEAVKFALQNKYIVSFLLANIVFDNLGRMLEQQGISKIKEFLRMLPIECRKSYFSSTPIDKKLAEQLSMFSRPPPKKKEE